MQITMNVAGQLNQIRLLASKALCPLFETVVNSLQSLEDTDALDKSIIIEAIRKTPMQMSLGLGATTGEKQCYDEFIVTDNGCGFDTKNFNSFLEAYSQLKMNKGCKGIGRFLWLKAFDSVEISSVYTEDGEWQRRSFVFSTEGITSVRNEALGDGNHARETIVHLKGLKPSYKDSTDVSLDELARKIIEHCLLYFITGECPAITLKNNLGEEISINEFYDNAYKDSLHQDKVYINGSQYTLYHMLLARQADKHELHLCANHREVKSIDISNYIPNLQKALPSGQESFYYVGYFTGKVLDESVNLERNEFDFTDSPVMNEKEIVVEAVGLISVYLHVDLEKIASEKKERIDLYVMSKCPQYRFLLNCRPEAYDQIPAGLNDEKLDFELYRQQQEWEMDVAKQKREIEGIHKKSAVDDASFQALFEKYCHNITDLSRAGLAEYVAKRKAVIDLLEKALESDRFGNYSKESRLHSIFCPMQVSSDEINYDDMNLWLIDDRLAYHRYLASDKRLNTIPLLDNSSNQRPDLAIFNEAMSYTSDLDNISSITIVELKRPMRDDLKDEENPVNQVLDYVDEIKQGNVKRSNGRSFGNVQNIPFYCYIIADLTPSMRKCARYAGLHQMQDGEGYFGNLPDAGVYIEILSYDKLLKNAKQRNRVFFDKLFEPKGFDLVYPELAFPKEQAMIAPRM